MNLGDFFSKEDKKRYLLENLKTGSVFYLFCKFPNRNKDKYLVIAVHPHTCEDNFLAFVINSNIPRFVAYDPELIDTQVLIEVSSHPFLDHDSYINCNEILELSFEDIEQQVLQDLQRIKGTLTLEVLQNIKTAITLADGLTSREKDAIREALDIRLS